MLIKKAKSPLRSNWIDGEDERICVYLGAIEGFAPTSIDSRCSSLFKRENLSQRVAFLVGDHLNEWIDPHVNCTTLRTWLAQHVPARRFQANG